MLEMQNKRGAGQFHEAIVNQTKNMKELAAEAQRAQSRGGQRQGFPQRSLRLCGDAFEFGVH